MRQTRGNWPLLFGTTREIDSLVQVPEWSLLDDNQATYASGDSRLYNALSSIRSYFTFGYAPNAAVISSIGSTRVTSITDGNGAGYAALQQDLAGAQSDANSAINLDAALPMASAPFQPAITAFKIVANTAVSSTVKLEIKSTADALLWTSGDITVNTGGVDQDIVFTPTTGLGASVKRITLVVSPTSDITIKSWWLKAAAPAMTVSQFLFLTSAAQVWRGFNPSNNRTRDKISDAPNTYDSTPAGGFQCLVSAMAYDMGMVGLATAQTRVQAAITGILGLPEQAVSKLLPHYTDAGGKVAGSEWSTVDTALAYFTALLGASALGLTTEAASIRSRLNALNLATLINGTPQMSHGYDDVGVLPYYWDYFGGESVISDLLRLYQNPALQPLAYGKTPPVWQDRAFILEMLGCFAPRFGRDPGADRYGTDWQQERKNLLARQRAADPWKYYGLSEMECVLANRNFFFLAGGSNPVVNTASGEGPYVTPHPFSLSADLAGNAIKTGRTMISEGIWHPVGGPPESIQRSGQAVGLVNHRQITLRGFFNACGWYWYNAKRNNRTLIRAALAGETALTAAINRYYVG